MPRRALLTAICLAATAIGPAADESRAVRAARTDGPFIVRREPTTTNPDYS